MTFMAFWNLNLLRPDEISKRPGLLAGRLVVSLPAVYHSAAVVNGRRDAIPEIGGDKYDHHHWTHGLWSVSSLSQLARS